MEPAEHAPAEHAPAEHAPAEHAIVAQGAYPMVRELQQLLARADIPAAILRPPAHGGG